MRKEYNFKNSRRNLYNNRQTEPPHTPETLLRQHANQIVKQSIAAVLPDVAVKRALKNRDFGNGKVILVAIGKAGWQMAKAASEELGERIDAGIVVTKYGHSKGEIADFQIVEAGHPLPDKNSFCGTQMALDLVGDLSAQDTVLFLISGGGSALFENPLIPVEELMELTEKLLASGADITEINTIRKRVSAVKGGRFAAACEPAKVYSIVLSDIIGDPLDMIASGPAYPDSSTGEDAKQILKKYGIRLTPATRQIIAKETPKELMNVETVVTGSVRELCAAAAKAADELGYEPHLLTDCLACEAREAGSFLASMAKTHQDVKKSVALIAGGETVVHLRGAGLGGRNQEIALSAALGIVGLQDTAIFSVGSDGTDGPTDAAGGFADGETIGEKLSKREAEDALIDNDAYHALQKVGGLIITGATGTNVNDVSVVLIRR